MSSTLRARTGRQLQRYDDHFRLVAGCVPYKIKQDGEDLISRLELLMISSPNRQDLVFPKGGWENDETIGEAACREALEEAGIRGIISEKELGEWKFRSKSRQNSCSTEGTCKGYMFALQVTEELDNWPEKSCHDRRWNLIGEEPIYRKVTNLAESVNAKLEVLIGRVENLECTNGERLGKIEDTVKGVGRLVVTQLLDSILPSFGGLNDKLVQMERTNGQSLRVIDDVLRQIQANASKEIVLQIGGDVSEENPKGPNFEPFLKFGDWTAVVSLSALFGVFPTGVTADGKTVLHLLDTYFALLIVSCVFSLGMIAIAHGYKPIFKKCMSTNWTMRVLKGLRLAAVFLMMASGGLGIALLFVVMHGHHGSST